MSAISVLMDDSSSTWQVCQGQSSFIPACRRLGGAAIALRMISMLAIASDLERQVPEES